MRPAQGFREQARIIANLARGLGRPARGDRTARGLLRDDPVSAKFRGLIKHGLVWGLPGVFPV